MAQLDCYYEGLNCSLREVVQESSEFSAIALALKQTHAATHSSFSLSILDIYECGRKGELQRYNGFLSNNPLDNRRLLWHGSRLVSFYLVNILLDVLINVLFITLFFILFNVLCNALLILMASQRVFSLFFNGVVIHP